MVLDAVTAPDHNSIVVMRVIDAMRVEYRELVHEFGFRIVQAMLDDGEYDVSAMRDALQTRRHLMQDRWLATQFVQPRDFRQIAAKF